MTQQDLPADEGTTDTMSDDNMSDDFYSDLKRRIAIGTGIPQRMLFGPGRGDNIETIEDNHGGET